MLIKTQTLHTVCFIILGGISNAIYMGIAPDIATTMPRLTDRGTDTYIEVFGGNGKTADGWPSMDQWIPTFEEMFNKNKPIMSASCTQFDAENDSETELAYLSSSIQSVAESSGVDARFILAIVLQESNGCVRVGTTNNGVTNPGLMQSHAGTGSCGSQKESACPESEILLMIKEGTEGTSSGDGLMQCLAANGGSGETAYYRAARCYNSGSVAASGNLGQGGSTHCYVSDVANRLLGWSSGPSGCNEATVGSLTGSSSQGTSSVVGSVSIASSTFATSPLTLPVSIPLTSPSTTPSTAVMSSAIPRMAYPYAISSCLSYAMVSTGDYCEKLETEYKISAVQLRDWNPGLDEACTNLWCGYSYCIKA